MVEHVDFKLESAFSGDDESDKDTDPEGGSAIISCMYI